MRTARFRTDISPVYSRSPESKLVIGYPEVEYGNPTILRLFRLHDQL